MAAFKLITDLPRETQIEIARIQAIASGQRNSTEAAFLTALAPYLHNEVIELDSSGLIISAAGNTVPTGDSGFRKGAIFIKKDASDDGRYVNTGNEITSTWTDMAPDGSGLIPAAQMRPYNVRGQVVKNTVYNRWDVISYRGKRILITDTVTSTNVDSTFISASKYTVLSNDSVYYAADAGVQADGTTDDTVALQAIIDQCAANGGGTIMLNGQYIMISATIVLKPYVWLKGMGRFGTNIKLLPNSNCHVIKNFVSTGSGVANAMFVGLFDLTIDGNKDNQNGAGPYHGIVFEINPLTSLQTGDPYFDPHYVVNNVLIYKAKGDGVHMTGRSAASLVNVVPQFCAGYGIYSTFDTNIIGCEADGNGKSGFYLPSGSIRGVGNKAYNNGQVDLVGAGFELTSNAAAVSLVACDAQNNKGQGFLLTGSKGINIQGIADSNNMSDGGYAGIELNNADDNIINIVCTQGMQGGVQVGHQSNALKIHNGSTGNSIHITHTALGGATIGTALTVDSVLTSNRVTINGVVQTITGGVFYNGMFGRGTLGAVNFDGTNTYAGVSKSGNDYTLNGDLHATQVDIQSGCKLKYNGWRVFCTGVYTNNGTIEDLTAAGTDGAAGSGGTAGNTNATGGAVSRGTAGGAGNTGAGSPANGVTSAMVGVGNGGAGGASGTGNAGATAQNSNNTGTGYLNQPYPFQSGVINVSAGAKPIGGAPGGGGGGGDGTNRGGGGGQGGSILITFANSFINHGAMNVPGSNGGNATVGNAGGGGGGGGGLILIFSAVAMINDGTSNVAGGTGGTGFGSGSSGTNGGNGQVVNVVLQ